MVVKLTLIKDDNGKITGMTWLLRKIDNSSLFDKYMSSGKKDESCYVEETITANYNVFNLYDSKSCKPKFYDGHFDEDFDIDLGKPIEESREGYIKFLEEFDDELPSEFYQRRKTA